MFIIVIKKTLETSNKNVFDKVIQKFRQVEIILSENYDLSVHVTRFEGCGVLRQSEGDAESDSWSGSASSFCPALEDSHYFDCSFTKSLVGLVEL